jgi:hypothetical protein
LIREKTARRAATAAAKLVVGDDSDEGKDSGDDSDLIISDSDEDFDFAKPKTAAKKKISRPTNSDDEVSVAKKPKKATAPINVSSDELFDSLVRSSPVKSAPEPQSSPDVVMLGITFLTKEKKIQIY